jgi:hypothetical protein
MPITAGADERPMVGFVAVAVPAPVGDLDDLDERIIRPRSEPIDDGGAAGEVLDLPGQRAVRDCCDVLGIGCSTLVYGSARTLRR